MSKHQLASGTAAALISESHTVHHHHHQHHPQHQHHQHPLHHVPSPPASPPTTSTAPPSPRSSNAFRTLWHQHIVSPYRLLLLLFAAALAPAAARLVIPQQHHTPFASSFLSSKRQHPMSSVHNNTPDITTINPTLHLSHSTPVRLQAQGHGSPDTPLDRYLRAMTDYTEYKDSDFPFTVDFQNALYNFQNRRSCHSASFLIYYVWGHGFGSFVRGMSTMLAVAASTNRILLLATGPSPPYARKANITQAFPRWNHAIGCAKEHPECFFQPVSSCNLSNVHQLMVSGKISYVELPENTTLRSVPPADAPRSPRVVVVRGKHQWLLPFRDQLPVENALRNLKLPVTVRDHPIVNSSNPYVRNRLWTMQASVYLLRLNARMRKIVKQALPGCFNGSSPDLDRIIGIPVRSTDKCYHSSVVNGKIVRGGEAKCVTLSDSLRLAKAIHVSQPWIDTILITSEDRRIVESANSLPEMALFRGHRWKLLTNAHDVHQGTGRAGALAAPGDTMGAIPGSKAYKIMESILTTVACQVLPKHRIVLLRSNFGDIIDVLSRAVPGRHSGLTINSGVETYPL